VYVNELYFMCAFGNLYKIMKTRGHKPGCRKIRNIHCDSRHIILKYTTIYV